MPHMNNGNNGPIKRSEYDSIPFKNKAIDTLKRVKLNNFNSKVKDVEICLLYTSPSPRDRTRSRMPSSA